MRATLVAAALLYLDATAIRHDPLPDSYIHGGDKLWDVIQQFSSVRGRPRHGSDVAILNDPFKESWDMFFLSNLYWDDHSLHIWIQNQWQLDDSRIRKMDYIFDFPNGRLTQIKP